VADGGGVLVDFGVGEGLGGVEVGVDDGVGDEDDFVGVGDDEGVGLGEEDGVGLEAVGVGVGLGVSDGVAVGVVRVVLPASEARVLAVVGSLVVAEVVGVAAGVLGRGPTSTVGGRSFPVLRRTTPAAIAPARTSTAAAATSRGFRRPEGSTNGSATGGATGSGGGPAAGSATSGTVGNDSAASDMTVSCSAVGRSSGALASIRSSTPSYGPASSGRS